MNVAKNEFTDIERLEMQLHEMRKVVTALQYDKDRVLKTLNKRTAGLKLLKDRVKVLEDRNKNFDYVLESLGSDNDL